jgi:hypothetical protein
MILVIPLKDIVVALHQIHFPSSNLVLPIIFYYQLEHIFFLGKTLFTLTLTTAPHLFLGRLSRMVYEHF